VSTQIAIRLPDAMVSELDSLVAAGEASSRASIIEQALRRELRRFIYEKEATILAAVKPDAHLEAWVDWAAANQLAID
jgi:metal-responsive CopG/Arc/MetJ family transcriptional regulator